MRKKRVGKVNQSRSKKSEEGEARLEDHVSPAPPALPSTSGTPESVTPKRESMGDPEEPTFSPVRTRSEMGPVIQAPLWEAMGSLPGDTTQDHSDEEGKQQERSLFLGQLSEDIGRKLQKLKELDIRDLYALGKELNKLHKIVLSTRNRGLDQPIYWVYFKTFLGQPLEEKWNGPHEVRLPAFTAIKIGEQLTWIHYSRVKKAPEGP